VIEAAIVDASVAVKWVVEEAGSDRALLLRGPVTLVGSRELLDAALGLSLDLSHPVYACVHLALAIRDGMPLLTADGRLSNAVARRKRVASHIRLLGEIPLP
jgi:predicted nucleic acid-binding protein